MTALQVYCRAVIVSGQKGSYRTLWRKQITYCSFRTWTKSWFGFISKILCFCKENSI